MGARNPARYLAPVALAATIAGGYLIVHHNISENSHSATTTSSSITSLHSKHHGDKSHAKYAKARFYTVKAGETLTAISQITGVALATLEQLNPRINPNALQTGQRLRLRQ